jgi:hypothetical protein
VQFAEDPRQLGARNVEQRGIGEDAVEAACREVEREEVLQPHLASAVGPCHLHEPRGAVEADGHVTARREGREIAPGPATEVEDREGRLARDVPQQRLDVLGDVVVARAFPEALGPAFVVLQRAGGDRRCGRSCGHRR